MPDSDLDLMRTFAVVKVPADASFSFDGSDADFRLRADLDRLNFSELDPGVVFGTLGGSGRRFDIVAAEGEGAERGYFDYSDGEIRLARRAIPAMLTLDPNAVRLDCLGYLMHRIGRDGRRFVSSGKKRGRDRVSTTERQPSRRRHRCAGHGGRTGAVSAPCRRSSPARSRRCSAIPPCRAAS